MSLFRRQRQRQLEQSQSHSPDLNPNVKFMEEQEAVYNTAQKKARALRTKYMLIAGATGLLFLYYSAIPLWLLRKKYIKKMNEIVYEEDPENLQTALL